MYIINTSQNSKMYQVFKSSSNSRDLLLWKFCGKEIKHQKIRWNYGILRSRPVQTVAQMLRHSIQKLQNTETCLKPSQKFVTWFYMKCFIIDVWLYSKYAFDITQKMKFSIKHFFSKCDQIHIYWIKLVCLFYAVRLNLMVLQ